MTGERRRLCYGAVTDRHYTHSYPSTAALPCHDSLSGSVCTRGPRLLKYGCRIASSAEILFLDSYWNGEELQEWGQRRVRNTSETSQTRTVTLTLRNDVSSSMPSVSNLQREMGGGWGVGGQVTGGQVSHRCWWVQGRKHSQPFHRISLQEVTKSTRCKRNKPKSLLWNSERRQQLWSHRAEDKRSLQFLQ